MPDLSKDFPILLSVARASVGHRRAAFLVGAVMFALFVGTVPIAQVQLVPFPGTILIQNTLAFLNDGLTAALLLGQYCVARSRAICVLAFGYLFTALMAISHALSFPELISPTGLLNGGPQETPWLYVAWHAVLPVAIISFALRRSDANPYPPNSSAAGPIGFTTLGAVGCAIAITWIIAAGQAWLPTLVEHGRLMPASKTIVAVLLLMPLGALLILASRRAHSVLDAWLMVVMLSWLCTISLVSFVSTKRYDVGWYIGRIFEAMTSLFVLVVLLSEIIALYAHNTHAAAVERRERARRLTEMEAVLAHLSRVNELGQNFSTLIHEISQPLAAISMYARASIKLLDDSTDRMRQLLEPLVEQAARALAIVQHLRIFIKRNGPNPLIQEIVGLIDDAVRLASVGAEALPPVDIRYHLGAKTAFFDRVQIEQVVVNLVRNAIEAMAGSERSILTITTEYTPDNMVEISIIDTGSGLSPHIRDQLFEPFVTTKASGLGVGLSICRVIIESHGGQLRAENNPDGGTIFCFTLPQTPNNAMEGDRA